MARAPAPDRLPARAQESARTRRDAWLTSLTLDGVPVGRIIEPDSALPQRAGYGFELLMPPGLGPVVGISAAQVIDTALARRAACRAWSAFPQVRRA